MLMDYPIAGKPTANYGKPFSYMQSCVPGGENNQRIVDSFKGNMNTSAARTRDFMLSLENRSSI